MARIEREGRTIEAMVPMYCADRHGGTAEAPCADCAELLDYARGRLAACRFGEGKPACSKCPVHCYRPDMRERARALMRWAGPRMLARHPLLAALHLADALRPRRRER